MKALSHGKICHLKVFLNDLVTFHCVDGAGSSTVGHLGGFQVQATINNAVISLFWINFMKICDYFPRTVSLNETGWGEQYGDASWAFMQVASFLPIIYGTLSSASPDPGLGTMCMCVWVCRVLQEASTEGQLGSCPCERWGGDWAGQTVALPTPGHAAEQGAYVEPGCGTPVCSVLSAEGGLSSAKPGFQMLYKLKR